ncbi:hypothetical protein GKQ77_12330 [Streptomyces sp. BG9H]|uniref:DNA primase/polymerase bifunctional N-terminal domain-containing protein n=1 Tax=Streptomyces anatolicus TaxID=2675858 RepID=A0ABS6YLR8_9ACTN|nr:hypothetical protein [Streptomyces anatolicus]MBW5422341.1 hypothetical protein [Streptomyces anatolicus]
MNSETSSLRVHDWIPATGHALRHAGIHFDAVRIEGALGEQVAYDLMQYTDFRAGPIVREATGGRYLYFLLPPQTADSYTWPVGARALSRRAGNLAYVGVPALDGFTWPLDWRSRPTSEVPYVEGDLLHEATERAVR